MSKPFSRRVFFSSAIAAGAGLALGRASAAATEAPSMNKPAVCVFSKHLQFLDYRQLASKCRELGLDGVDLTVRSGGHVLPERVATDLPEAVKIIRDAGLDVPMITTRLYDGADADARPIIEAASKCGVRYVRVGGQKYSKDGDPLQELGPFADELRSLATIAAEYGIVAGYHNHSGYENVGAPLWDLHRIITDVASAYLGSNFDVGHAKVEGAFGAWEINARMMAPYVRMLAVKDFVWENGEPKWVPLGEGLVDTTAFLSIFKKAGFAGPISLHYEYETASNEALLEDIRRSASQLRNCLSKAGYA